LSKNFAWEEIAMINKKIAGLVLTTVLACVSLPVNKLVLGGTNDVAIVMADEEENLKASGTCGENASWQLYEDGTLVISGTGDMTDYNYGSDVPWHEYVDDIHDISISEGITSISSYAFYNCSNATKVTIPEGITSISSNAFEYCSSITNIVIPEGVTSVGSGAFYGCTSLTDISIPTTATDIGYSAFEKTPWQEKQGDFVIVNGTLLAYQGSDSEVVIPNTVNTMVNGSISSNASIESITIPDSVTCMLSNAISNCSNLKTVTIPGSVVTVPSHAVFCSYNLETVIMESGVKYIDEYAFVYEYGLSNVVIPDTVISIGSDAFYCCDALKNVTIPASVTEIGYHAFGFDFDEKVIDGFTITGYSGSGAEAYVKNIDDTELWNKGLITFVSLDAPAEDTPTEETPAEEKPVSKTDISKASVKLSKTSYTYTGKANKPAVTVKVGDTALKTGTDYKATYSNNIKVGTAKLTITGQGNYSGSITKTFKITKAAQKINVKTTSKQYSKTKVKKASQTFSLGASASGKGKLSYKKTSGNSKITVNKKTGKVTVKKGTAKGTYKIKVQIKAAATSNYKAATVTKTITVKVK
jgi:hypothetical protein